MQSEIIFANGGKDQALLARMANRHGLIAGATGTGKTVSVRVLAEGFSEIGVPVFLADVKGDLSGIAAAGALEGKIKERAEELKLSEFSNKSYPVVFWDIFADSGHPLRATVSDLGPLLISRLLNLNDTQTAVLTLVFKVADDNGMLLLDLKDLQAMVQHVGENADEYTSQYGNVSKASVGAIQRALLTISEQHADKFFGEPALNIDDLMQTSSDGRGVINILQAQHLMEYPKVYATVLLWMLSELFEHLPEVGDPEKPKLVFFFDEAHLLFDDAPKVLLEKIERVARLIRSKGIGIYFITQNPVDIPDTILGQLGNRVQHALRAFTPRDQKAVRAAAETFRSNPELDVEKAITELAVGEALVSCLDEKGMPGIVERALIYPPHSRLEPLSPEDRKRVISQSLLFGHYEKAVDRESAYEILKKKASASQAPSEVERPAAYEAPVPKEAKEPAKFPGRPRQSVVEAFVKSTVRSIGSQIGNRLMRGILGSLMKTGSR